MTKKTRIRVARIAAGAVIAAGASLTAAGAASAAEADDCLLGILCADESPSPTPTDPPTELPTDPPTDLPTDPPSTEEPTDEPTEPRPTAQPRRADDRGTTTSTCLLAPFAALPNFRRASSQMPHGSAHPLAEA